ncbi:MULTISPECIES: hypothetical protein [Inquilinus]|uniref:Uncharacterized protein n=1 Tax=Inquilinus ginsengisoli TaxID=363840 RepID=A0ABU1JI16_9PROT|nr:hypothetical protein [Inquilinus ginsengisoli]MDR6288257.1 hypothetical protein [Inquilinus ginsengisoli]
MSVFEETDDGHLQPSAGVAACREVGWVDASDRGEGLSRGRSGEAESWGPMRGSHGFLRKSLIFWEEAWELIDFDAMMKSEFDGKYKYESN